IVGWAKRSVPTTLFPSLGLVGTAQVRLCSPYSVLARLDHHRRVGQFIAAATLRGKMLRQQPRHFLDAFDGAVLEEAGAEFLFHGGADLLPAGLADPGVDATIGNDLDVAVGEQEID